MLRITTCTTRSSMFFFSIQAILLPLYKQYLYIDNLVLVNPRDTQRRGGGGHLTGVT